MFESEAEAERALQTKNMEYLRDRYIEIYEYKWNNWKKNKVVNIFLKFCFNLTFLFFLIF